jgi:hypothetical protein
MSSNKAGFILLLSTNINSLSAKPPGDQTVFAQTLFQTERIEACDALETRMEERAYPSLCHVLGSATRLSIVREFFMSYRACPFAHQYS